MDELFGQIRIFNGVFQYQQVKILFSYHY